MRAICDFDILRYEIGFAAETGWKAITEDPDAIPPFDYVERLLLNRIAIIKGETGSEECTGYITEGRTFRFDIATVKPYKGTRKSNKPWHFNNLTVYMRDILGARVITEIEADDAMAIDHVNSEDETVLCSRDKDLRQVPGMFFSWELGRQPSFGPVMIDEIGAIELSEDRKSIKGTGFAFFCSQVLTGDTVDNIPGLPTCGPVAAYEALEGLDTAALLTETLIEFYDDHYGAYGQERLLEQGQLCWLLRESVIEKGMDGYVNNFSSQLALWRPGMYK